MLPDTNSDDFLLPYFPRSVRVPTKIWWRTGYVGISHLLLPPGSKLPQPPRPLLGHHAPRFRLHHATQPLQLLLKMPNCPVHPTDPPRAAKGKCPPDPHGTERIQPVGILHDAQFRNALNHLLDFCHVVDFSRVGYVRGDQLDFLRQLRRGAVGEQKVHSHGVRFTRVGGIFLVSDVVQEAREDDQVTVVVVVADSTLAHLNSDGEGDYTLDVLIVVRGIVIFHGFLHIFFGFRY